MKLLKHIRRHVNILTTNFIWAVLRGKSSRKSEAELEFRSIEREVKGEARAVDYLSLPLWQSYSVADKREMGLMKGDAV